MNNYTKYNFKLLHFVGIPDNETYIGTRQNERFELLVDDETNDVVLPAAQIDKFMAMNNPNFQDFTQMIMQAYLINKEEQLEKPIIHD